MKKQIYLIDLTHESKLGLGSDTMPLQLGLIGAYCLKEYCNDVEVKIFKFVDEFVKAVEKEMPFIIASSNYMWNIDLSYKIVSTIKEKYPKIIVVFGGPNYPDDLQEQIDWLCQHPNVDFYIFKDGEVPFSRLVGFLLNNPDLIVAKKLKLPSCHALIQDQPYFGELEERLDELSTIPSPYTNGLMDKFFEQKLQPTIQTNRGCPFNCSYCTEGGLYYHKICKIPLLRKIAEIDYIASKTRYTKTLCITDSNFGMYEEDITFCEYLGKVREKTGFPEYLNCSTGKNQKDRILKCNTLLGGIMRFTASVQSLNKKVLKNIKRTNISLNEIMTLSDHISDTETHSYSEIILGLPGDSLETQKESMSGLMLSGISNITQHQMVLLYGTQVASHKSRQKFNIRGMFRPIQRCAGIYNFDNKAITAIEIEEIVVATATLSFEDYLEARRLYLTIGFFYNDRIFGEIHSLLRLLHLSTWEWIDLIHKNIVYGPKEIQTLYDDFTVETKNELWENCKDLARDISREIGKYVSGQVGGNLIYKYRSQAIIKYFDLLHKIAFKCLRDYLTVCRNKCDDIVNEIERFSKYQKSNLFNTDFTKTELFNYDLVRMIKNPLLAREGGSLEDIFYPTEIHITHTAQQKELISRQLDFYGNDINGLTMLISRFPIKRFYRTPKVVT